MSHTHRPAFYRRLWAALHEPPLVTLAATIGYFGLATGGIMSLIHPPGTIQSELGPFVTFAWSCFALVGGALGVLATPRGIWWLERVGLISVATFLAIYGTTIAGLQITSSGSRWMQLGLLVWGAHAVLSRWDRTSGAALDPQGGAIGRLRHGDRPTDDA